MNDLIQIDEHSRRPKYQQIISSVIGLIGKGKLKRGAQLPSISELAEWQHTAKVTVAKAYEQLRQQGVIHAQHGKGFYVARTNVKTQMNIFLLFDTLNAYKEVLYNTLTASLPSDTQFSLFFHHYNKALFKSLIDNNLGNFNHYIVMPHFDEDVSSIVNVIPRDQLLLIDKDLPKLKNDYAAVFQDFDHDIYNALEQAQKRLSRYRRLNLVLGEGRFQYVPKPIIEGFKRFAKRRAFSYQIIDSLKAGSIRKGEAYIVFSDTDMIQFIKQINDSKLTAGKDIGLISYDDTPLKEILLNGITVITTDFEAMGRTAARMILQKEKATVTNPGKLILRQTL